MSFFKRPLIAAFADSLSDIVFPPKCAVCNGFYQRPSHRGLTLPKGLRPDDNPLKVLNASSPDGKLGEKVQPGLLSSYWCETCIGGFKGIQSPLCQCCGMMFQSREGPDHQCGDCIKHPKHFTTARAAGAYSESLMIAIHRFKYHGKIQLAKPLSLVLFTTFRQYWPSDPFDLILPVPLHVKRLIKRGFNQAYLLVKDWMRIALRSNGSPSRYVIARDTLIRQRPTAPQTGLRRKDRIRNTKNAFGLKKGAKINQKNVLLVDDVYTTGSTVDECARILLKSGAKRVDVLTLARSL